MERQLDHFLDGIRQDLLRMGAQVQEMVADSLTALLEHDAGLAASVRSRDREIDNIEKKVDEDCHLVLAKHQPTAIDLRFLVAAMKITSELERIGDSAVNIAQAVDHLDGESLPRQAAKLPELSGLVGDMIRDALQAMIDRDSALALEVLRRDDRVDDEYRHHFGQLLASMIERPEGIRGGLQLLLVARTLERIGDHATNIAEDVIYYVEGRDIRHEKVGELPPAD